MGSRAIAVVARDADGRRARFGVDRRHTGAVHTRTGRPFFADTPTLVDRLRAACAPLFDVARDRLAGAGRRAAAVVGEGARADRSSTPRWAPPPAPALPAALAVLEAAAGPGARRRRPGRPHRRRCGNAEAFRDAYAAYCRPTDGLDGVTLAPFQILAAEGRALAADRAAPVAPRAAGALTDDLLTPTRHRFVDLSSAEERADAATQWWLELTGAGGEGMVVKPAHLVERPRPAGPQGARPRVPADHLRARLHRLARRAARPHLARSGSLAQREHGLGLDALAGSWTASRSGGCTRRSSPSSPWSRSPSTPGCDGSRGSGHRLQKERWDRWSHSSTHRRSGCGGRVESSRRAIRRASAASTSPTTSSSATSPRRISRR